MKKKERVPLKKLLPQLVLGAIVLFAPMGINDYKNIEKFSTLLHSK